MKTNINKKQEAQNHRYHLPYDPFLFAPCYGLTSESILDQQRAPSAVAHSTNHEIMYCEPGLVLGCWGYNSEQIDKVPALMEFTAYWERQTLNKLTCK